MARKNDPAPLPIKLDSTSNGEFLPIPLTATERRARRFAHERAGEAARKTGRSRRNFLASSCGAAATLLAFNQVQAWSGEGQGAFDLPAEAAFDAELAASRLEVHNPHAAP